LAAFIARNLNYRYYEHTVTAITRAQDLLWHFDTVRRLSDAQVRKSGDPPLSDADYVEPGVLWWAFDRDLALHRGIAKGQTLPKTAATEPEAELNRARLLDRAVVLIDEIDKADPDLPNGLLEPLSSSGFLVHETGAKISRPTRTPVEVAEDPISHLLIMITTNEERDLPPAFVRRCIVFQIEHPEPDRLVEIARLHFSGPGRDFNERLCQELAKRVAALREQAEREGLRPPGIAEYLDVVRACATLRITPDDSRTWQILASATLAKDAPSDRQAL
jgi:MoxR-like ATPase